MSCLCGVLHNNKFTCIYKVHTCAVYAHATVSNICYPNYFESKESSSSCEWTTTSSHDSFCVLIVFYVLLSIYSTNWLYNFSACRRQFLQTCYCIFLAPTLVVYPGMSRKSPPKRFSDVM